MRDLLCPEAILKFTNYADQGWKNQWKLKINSKKLTQQLTKLGCVQAKSLILTWPQWLTDQKLQQHFIRGYFDGDGSLYAKEPSKTGHIDWGWQITSTGIFCEKVKNIIESYFSPNAPSVLLSFFICTTHLSYFFCSDSIQRE